MGKPPYDSITFWRKKALMQRLPKKIVTFLEKVEAQGRKIHWLHDIITSKDLIVPNPAEPYKVAFNDINGVLRPECTVTMASNGVGIIYDDPLGTRRPKKPNAFVVSNYGKTSKLTLKEAFDLQYSDVYDNTCAWLGNYDLCLIPCYIGGKDGNNCVMHTLSIVPVQLAWTIMAWGLIHKVPTMDEVLSCFNPEAIFLSGLGLRYPMFNGEQTTLFHKEDGYRVVISTSTYLGLAYSKKPIFFIVSEKLVDNGGYLHHLSSGIFEYDTLKLVIALIGRSGAGKSELVKGIHVNDKGFFRLGKNAKGKDILLYYPKQYHSKITVSGDDGGIVYSFELSKCGKMVIVNLEHIGRFNRTDEAAEEGAIPDSEFVLQKAQEEKAWYNSLTLNIEVEPGQETKLKNIAKERKGGKLVSNTNPRSSELWEYLEAGGLKVCNEQLEVDVLFNSIRTSKLYAPFSYINKMPPYLFYLYLAAGITKAKSKSVEGSKHNLRAYLLQLAAQYLGINFAKRLLLHFQGRVDEKAIIKELMCDLGGTMSAFTPKTAPELFNALCKEIQKTPNTARYINAVGYVAGNHMEYESELLAREHVIHEASGVLTCEYVIAGHPIFGYQPHNVIIAGQNLNELEPTLTNPMLYYGESKYIDLAKVTKKVLLDEFLPHYQELDEKPKEIVDILKAMPIKMMSVKEREEILTQFN